MDYKTLFEKTPPTRLFFKAAIPGAVGMLASALYQLADGIFVGQILGDTAFAALNLAMPLVIINFSLADLIGIGSAVPISIRLGEKNEKEANNIFSCACLLILATAVVLGAALFAAAPALIRMMGADDTLLEPAVQYLRVYALCSPLTTVVFAVDNYLRICGRIRGSMLLNIFMSVVSAGLEFVFLFVFRWGIWGAALATCTGMFICALLAFYPFLRGRMQLRFCRPRFSAAMIRKIIACGSPSFLSNIAGRLTSILMNIILLRLGGAAAVSVYGILMYADGFVQPLLYGMCDSLQPAVGYNWGARRYDRVWAIERRCFTVSGLLSVAAAVVLLVFPNQVIALFMNHADAALLQMAVPALQLFSLTYLTRWFSFASQSFLSAIGKPVSASVISLSITLVFPLLLIAALWPAGLTGLWLNLPVTSLLAAVLSAVLLVRFNRRRLPDGIPGSAQGQTAGEPDLAQAEQMRQPAVTTDSAQAAGDPADHTDLTDL